MTHKTGFGLVVTTGALQLVGISVAGGIGCLFFRDSEGLHHRLEDVLVKVFVIHLFEIGEFRQIIIDI